MIITCGSCGTKYSVAEVALQPNGRRVRCSNCGASWHQPPPSPPLAPAPQPVRDSAVMAEPPPPLPPRPDDSELPEDAPPIRPTRPRPGPAGGLPAVRPAPGRVAAAWLLVLLLIGGTAAAAYVGRDEVVRLWPPAYQLYHVLGVPVDVPLAVRYVPAAGFDIIDVVPRFQEDGGTVTLEVSGVITNTTGEALTLPPLVITVLDAAGDALDSEVATLSAAEVEAGGAVPFAIPLPVPSLQAARLELTLRAS